MEEPKIARNTPLPEERHEHLDLKFSPGFLWGTSTAAYQVEGGNTHSDWWEWEAKTGRIADGSRSGQAADHYRLWETDLKLAKDLHLNAQRISIEWSRIEPEEGKWNEEAISHYREELRAMKRDFFTVMLTLYHFTLPQWVADQGGWEKASTVRHFERFAKKMAEEYAGYVDQWITINEPMIYLSQAYLSDAWPPGRKSVPATIRAFRNLCRAHRQAYQVIHSVAPVVSGKPASVGIAKNVISFDPYRKHARRDVWFVRLADWLWNHLFFSRTRNTHDFIGINYYFHYRVAFVPSEYHHFFFQVRNENREVSDVGWEVYPSGIFAAIQDMAIYKKPIYITENGIASTNDDKRIRFLVSHLKEVYHAIQSGIDVRGYFHWSLLDNFEWEKGFGPRFGLIEVDYDTMERKPRRSAGVYGSIAQQNGISHELLRFLGHRVL